MPLAISLIERKNRTWTLYERELEIIIENKIHTLLICCGQLLWAQRNTTDDLISVTWAFYIRVQIGERNLPNDEPYLLSPNFTY